MSHDVFISYASDDGDKARGILEFLKSRGISCWIDKEDLRFTRRYDRAIEQAIRRSRVVVWLASGRSLASDYVKFEISTALNHGRPIGPVYLEPIDPAGLPAPFNLKLAAIQGIEYYEGSTEENLEKLAGELRALVRASRRRQMALGAAILIAVAAAIGLGLWGILLGRQDVQRAGVPASPGTVPSSDPWAVPAARPFPPQVASLPAADVLKIAYTGSPPAAASQAQRPGLQMEILARRSGESTFSPLRDGGTLASETDDYFIALRPFSAGFLYVFQIDATGKKEWLFPENGTSSYSSGSNPVRPDEILQVPSAESDRVLFLDDTTGVEHIYTVFSAARWPDLEDALARPVPSPPPSPATGPGALLAAVTVRSPNGLLGRGVGGVRVKTSTGQIAESFLVKRTNRDQTCSLPVSAQPLQASGRFLVCERWFTHVDPHSPR